ncbi:MAG: hypothetical protein JSV12_00955 [Candidatus Bathyarchaeota archaeon]|nr:MAG: hypothetical protein JSV12_00955 [Candidatus Bathyarchaeota archaeon]
MKKEIVEKWTNEHPTVRAWLNRLAPSTRYNYLIIAYDFFNWISHQPGYEGVTPDELLELQDKCQGRERFKQLSMLQTWVQPQNVRLGSKLVRYGAIRSFYEHNHVVLPRDPSFRLRANKPPLESEMTFDDLKKIILSCNETYQAVYLIMFQSAMGCAEFEYFNNNSWPEVKPQLEEGKKQIKVTLPGRKSNKNKLPYYTFFGKDGVRALETYLSEKRVPMKNGEAIFLNEKGEPITKRALERYFTRHAIKVGVIKRWTPSCPECGEDTRYSRTWRGKEQPTLYICNHCGKETRASEINIPRDIRYKVHPHEMRDLFRSEWDLSPARSVCAEFFMGHNIDSNNYNKIMKLHLSWAENQYALAEPYLNILSEDPRKIDRTRLEELVENRVRERLATEQGNLKKRLAKVEELLEKMLEEKT